MRRVVLTAIAPRLVDTQPVAAALDGASDEQLARRAQAGCMRSFEELVRRYQVPLLRFLLKRCRNKHDAEDVLQESFLQAYRALHQYRDHWPFRTWLYTLTSRRAISHARKAIPAADSPALLGVAGRDDGPAGSLERAEAQQHIWDTARRVLTDEQYTAIFLQYVEAMPTGQIARVLGRSWVSTKTLLHRARRKLLPSLSSVAGASPALVVDPAEEVK